MVVEGVMVNASGQYASYWNTFLFSFIISLSSLNTDFDQVEEFDICCQRLLGNIFEKCSLIVYLLLHCSFLTCMKFQHQIPTSF